MTYWEQGDDGRCHVTVRVQRRGRYELFETPRGHRILALDGTRWFAWVRGQQGEILVVSDADHVRERTLRAGEYYLVSFENDPDFSDVPHLFLEQGGRYLEVILPNGLPSDTDRQKRIVSTEKHVGPADLPVSSAPTGDRSLPIPDYDDLSVRGARVRLEGLGVDDLRRIRAHEAGHKNRKTLLNLIDRRVRDR